jgi:hypothetical protein
MDELLLMERELRDGAFNDGRDDEEEEFVAPAVTSSMGMSASGEDDFFITGAANVRWRRPEIDPSFDPKTSSLAFQWTAIDLMSGEALAVHPRGNGHTVPGSSSGPVPVIR